MKIAVTGLTGFLGHYVAKRFFEKDIQIQALIRNTSNVLHLQDFQKNIKYVQGNLDDKETLKKFVQGAEIVVHMAYERNGASFHEAGDKDIKRFVETNLLGSVELLDAAKYAGVKQFIFISSCAVYGFIFPHIRLDELHPLLPDSHYGAYKASVEAFCHSYFLSKHFDMTIFRPVGIYGIAPHLAHSAWYNIVKDIKHSRDVEVSGGGKIVSVEEVVRAIELTIGNKNASGKIYNLSDMYIDNMSIAQIAREICGTRSIISGTQKKPINTIDNTESKGLGVRYSGIEGVKQYIRDLVGRI
ncbi:MAG: NAD(P)-dependent oxidoreductase [Candidatus Kuenenia sp.]|nr:NAD(P)-dependent oxidoreductase [Candidatus Kuenenia hertensis]